nr:chemotaxis protein CheC [Evansella caseinilytica]
MNVKHINAVCRAAKSLLHSHFGIDVEPMKPRADQFAVPSSDISVVLGVTGQLSGQIICSVTSDTAKNIVGLMMGGMEITTMDEIGWSAIREFGNWVAGSTATELSKEDCVIDVTPPVVNEGASNFRGTNLFITVPFESQIGLIDIHISLYEKAS